MKYQQLNYLPKPLLDDIVNDRCLPIIGAGFSLNADMPDGCSLPVWNELGKLFAEEMSFPFYNNPIDSISAFAHEYKRPKLIEKLSEFLNIGKITPGTTHLAFAYLFFQEILTTNFDCLLERAYNLSNRNPRIIIDEDQLSINNNKCTIIKMHGDLEHPKKLVVTEKDYDLYISKNPLMCTYISNLLITKTPLFIGYSLDDPDSRQIWQIIGNRLGEMRRTAYVLSAEITKYDQAKYERRGVKVINLKSTKSNYSKILTALFKELRQYWKENTPKPSNEYNEDLHLEFSLPASSITRLCYFSIPSNLIEFYRTQVFPIFLDYGFVPVIASDIIEPGDNIYAKVEATIEKSFLVVADYNDTEFIKREISIAISLKKRHLFISEENKVLPIDYAERVVISRPPISSLFDSYGEIYGFLNSIEKFLSKQIESDIYTEILNEPRRLFSLKEYNPSVISAISNLESELKKTANYKYKNNIGIMTLIKEESYKTIISSSDYILLKDVIGIRNKAVHSNYKVTRREAKFVIEFVERIISIINQA